MKETKRLKLKQQQQQQQQQILTEKKGKILIHEDIK